MCSRMVHVHPYIFHTSHFSFLDQLASETTHDQGGPVQVGETGQEDTSNHNTTRYVSIIIIPMTETRKLSSYEFQCAPILCMHAMAVPCL